MPMLAAFSRKQQLEDEGAQSAMVRVLVELEDFDAAYDTVDRMPESAEREYLNGLIEEKRGRVERAIACLESALELESENVEAAFKLGVLLDRIGDDDMAIEYYMVCSDANPQYLPGVINLGILYDERGEANAAIDCFRQVLAYNLQNRRAALLLRDSTASRNMYYDEKEEREKEKMSKSSQRRLMISNCQYVAVTVWRRWIFSPWVTWSALLNKRCSTTKTLVRPLCAR